MQEDNKVKYIEWGLMIAAVIMLIPILVYATRSTPAYDDFLNAVTSKEYWKKDGSSFKGALDRTKDYYFTVGGYYFAGFINFFVSPFLRWGITGLRAVNTLIQLLFYGSAFFMIRTFANRRMGGGRALTWFIFDVFIFLFNDIVYDWEIYTWHTVLIAYLVPLALFMISMGLTVIYDDKERSDTWLLVLISALAFLVSGSSLNISALNCGMFLVISAHRYLCKKDRKPVAIAFAFALAGALVNVAAPGNYTRHNEGTADYSVLSSLKDTLICVLKMLESRFTQTLFPAVLVITALVLYRYVDMRTEEGRKHPFAGLLLVLAGTVTVDFPVCFGYGGMYFPVRCIFVQDMAFYILLFLWLVHFTGWLQERSAGEELSAGVMVSVLISCLLFSALICQDKTGDDALPTRYMTASVLTGRLEEATSYQMGLLNEIREAPGDDVVLYRDEPVTDNYLQQIGITTFPDHWINESICDFYGKKSLYIQYEEE